MSDELIGVEDLPRLWREDLATYPHHLGGRLAAAALSLCARELENVLAGRDRNSTGVVEETSERAKTEGDQFKVLRQLLKLEQAEEAGNE